MIGRPLGRRCAKKVGSDAIILTQNGAFALSTLLTESGVNYQAAISNKIENLFNEQARTYSTTFGWCTTIFPAQSAAIFNVPQAEDGTHTQFVMNTITKSWCKFTDWNAEDFAVFNDELYFCQSTKVIKAWTGTSDQGNNISAYAKTAFNYFGNKTQEKHFKLFRPVLLTNGGLSFLTDIDVDFKDEDITGTASYSVTSSAIWDGSSWDNAYWASGLQITKNWQGLSEWPGYSAAGKIKIDTNALVVQWVSSDYVFETGGIL